MTSTPSNQAGFDALSYLAANPDLIRAFGVDTTAAAQHYSTHGIAEGRSTTFDALSYEAANPDLPAAFGTDTVAATRHYIEFGLKEGRTTTFDALSYVAANPDLLAAFGTDTAAATRHYIEFGLREGRNTYFNTAGYLSANADLRAAFGTDMTAAQRHYIQNGFREGRTIPIDDYAENTTTIGRVSSGTAATGMIERAYDVDWFKTTLNAGTTYTLSVTFPGKGTHDFALIDERGTILASDSDPNGDGVHTVTYTPGTSSSVYAAVSGFSTGRYSIAMTGGDVTNTTTTTTTTTITTTTPVTLSDDFSDNIWTTGRLTVGGTASGVVEKDFDKDWFAVTLERGSVYRFGTSVGTGGSRPTLRLYDAAGYRMTTRSYMPGGESMTSTPEITVATTGTYYLEHDFVLGPGARSAVPYTVWAQKVAIDSAFSDDFGDSPGTAGRMSVGETITGAINQTWDEDYIALSLQQGHSYTFDVTTPGQAFNLAINDALGNEGWLGPSDDSAGIYYYTSRDGHRFYSYTANKTETYRIKLSGNDVGPYSLKATDNGMVDDIANDASTTAGLAIGGSATGHIDYRPTGGALNGDSDWFAVSLQAGQTYEFDLKRNGDGAGLILRDQQGNAVSGGTSVDFWNYTWGNDSLLYTATRSGTHYLTVNALMAGTGTDLAGYTVSAHQIG
ncbi:hypothetical protein SAMN02982917_3376 [Azospirillum oryzae]|uniref:Pre-peptidase C-terminal domain-containing protein n=1 Tax=Azospirillum oryzae TaxID=286727 RepID=A0A1X7G6T9_9PROT|nr:PPC domain-containing protein [Azospirillum oryzae]SMF65034.1 hypothetical protein SAMN02982917_3376 [Azospirillum oryzae]